MSCELTIGSDGCSNRRPFGGAISTVLNDLPDELLVLRSLEGMMNKDYAIASDAFAVICQLSPPHHQRLRTTCDKC